MNLQTYFLKAFALAPAIWAGIAFLHSEKDQATKLQLAQQSLQLATGVEDNILPAGDQQLADLASKGLEAILNAAVYAHQTAAAAAAPVPAV